MRASPTLWSDAATFPPIRARAAALPSGVSAARLYLPPGMDAAANLVDGENSARCKRGTADCVPTAAGITPDDTGPDMTAKSGTGSVEPNYKHLVDLVYLICSMPPEIYEAPENDRLGENPACNCHSPPATHCAFTCATAGPFRHRISRSARTRYRRKHAANNWQK